MRRTVGLIREGKYYHLSEGEVPPPRKEPYGKAPAIQTDTIERVWCDGTGQYHESRSEMKRALKENGATDVSWDYKPSGPSWKSSEKEVKDELTKTYHDIKNGNCEPLPEDIKQTCKELDERLGWKSK